MSKKYSTIFFAQLRIGFKIQEINGYRNYNKECKTFVKKDEEI